MTKYVSPIPFSHYDDRTNKTQIVLSATGSQLPSMEWLQEPHRPGMLPSYVVDRSGEVGRVFSSLNYSNYLQFGERDKQIINIAIDNCGALRRGGDGKFYPVILDEHEMPLADESKPAVRFFAEFCEKKPHKGFTHYELIYPSQIEALKSLLRYLLRMHGIDYHFDPLTGGGTPNFYHDVQGIYLAGDIKGCCHDLHPQIELINLLKSISL